MAGWLTRAKDAFRKPAPPPPEPFQVECDCGVSLAGERLNAAQRPACRSCGRALFVLPANVYPATPRPAAAKAPPASTPAKPGAAQTRGKAASPPEPQSAPAPQGILLEKRVRLVTPFRLIVGAILILGTVTGVSLWRRQQYQSALRIVVAAQAAGLKALSNGDFVAAASELTKAKDAVDVLGRTDPEANEIRRQAREAVAGHHLSEYSLIQIAADCAEELRGARSRFGTRHQDAWVVFDTVIANPHDEASPCELDLPIIVDGLKLRIEVDSAVVRRAAQRDTAGSRVIFAAQLQSVRPATETSPVGTLVLDGKTAFLWTSLATYEALGYVDSPEETDATRALLARQQEEATP